MFLRNRSWRQISAGSRSGPGPSRRPSSTSASRGRSGPTRLDHCFTDLDRGEDGRARVAIGETTLWADEAYPYLMVFTGDGLPDVERRSLAVEPMTCAPNAFVSGQGLVLLEPGDSHAAAWGITP